MFRKALGMMYFRCCQCGKYVDDGSSLLNLCLECLDKYCPPESDDLPYLDSDDLPDPKEYGYFTNDDFITVRI